MRVVYSGIGHCSYKYITLKDTPGANVTLQQIGFQPDFTVYLHIRQTWLAFSKLTTYVIKVIRILNFAFQFFYLYYI